MVNRMSRPKLYSSDEMQRASPHHPNYLCCFRSLYLLAGFVAVIAVGMAVAVNHVKNKVTAGVITISGAVIVSLAVYIVSW